MSVTDTPAMPMTETPALPPEAPMDMPTQALHRPPAHGAGLGRRPATRPRLLGLRRLFVIGGAVVLTVLGAEEMYYVLNGNGVSTLGLVVLALFVVLFAWIALSLMSAVGGFLSMLTGGGLGLGIQRGGALPVLSTRTALLMPTYNENPARVMGGVQAIFESLMQTGQHAQFDLFILSDTTDPDTWVAEEAAFLALRERTGGHEQIFYRRRPKNIERKAGNLAEWVKRFGAAYPQMLTLDADSVMTGEIIVRMTAAMEAHPGVGLIQTLPVVVSGSTLFARAQQFAGRVYGPLIAHGIAWWHGSEGNYWGHNAVIRTRAFAEQAGLPTLRGRKPFGGHILSHDFVEAALMRRGGWAIHMVPALSGSFEESPPSLTDVAIRDRRWCQGNLQHAAILPTRGLHWVSRLHLLMGIGSYVTSPLWLAFLLAGVLISLQARFVRPEYFGDTKSLFPNWPQVDPVRAKYVFIVTMAVLLAPKLLAYLVLLVDGPLRRGCGGAIRAAASVVIETLVGGLIAPIAMLIQTTGVISILAGRDSGWNAQRRDDGGVPFSQIWAKYWRFTLFGLLLAWAAWAVSLPLFLWMLPVLVGLGLAVPLAAGTASRRIGRSLRRLGLLRTPEEASPPPVLQRAMEIQRADGEAEVPEGIARLLADPVLLRCHRGALPPAPDRKAPVNPPLAIGMAKLARADTLAEAVATLSAAEKAALLLDDAALDRLEALAAAH